MIFQCEVFSYKYDLLNLFKNVARPLPTNHESIIFTEDKKVLENTTIKRGENREMRFAFSDMGNIVRADEAKNKLFT